MKTLNHTGLSAYKMRMSYKQMDMSGGDSIDGPRWTGRYVDCDIEIIVVAPTAGIAKEVAKVSFSEYGKVKLEECEEIGKVNALCTIFS